MKKKLIIGSLCLALLASASCTGFGNPDRASENPAPQQAPLRPAQGANPFTPEQEGELQQEAFSEQRMLLQIGTNVIAPAVHQFALEAELLKARITESCDSLEMPAAQAQWRRAMRAYHFIDSFAVGPVSDSSRSLADQIYSYPYLNLCGIDQEVVRLVETGSPSAQLPFNRKGLGALEYLLFEPNLSTPCNPRANPKVVAWAQKPAAEKRLDRCRLAKLLSQDLSDKAKALDSAWAVDQGNFSKTLVDGSRYSSIQEATNQLSDSLLAMESLKDQRLAKPLGRSKECTNASKKCPEMAEHSWSGMALQAMESRIQGFRAAFFGNRSARARALGFDDFLAQKGHGDIAERIATHLDAAERLISNLDSKGSFQDQISRLDPESCKQTTVDNPQEPLCALYLEVRAVVTSMKTEVLAVLSLREPASHQGDND